MSTAPEPQPNVGVGDIVVPDVPQPIETEHLYDLEVEDVEHEKAVLANEAFRQDMHHRARWGSRVFWLLVGWLVAVVIVMAFQGLHPWGFKLDDSVVITFITTTTVNVLSLGYIVANYLFPKK